jgi:hypothetical protein
MTLEVLHTEDLTQAKFPRVIMVINMVSIGQNLAFWIMVGVEEGRVG